MPEVAIVTGIAWLLLAGASFRFRKDAGVTDRHQAQKLRLVATVLLLAALLYAGTGLTGERWVRAIGGASLAAVLVVLGLSFHAPRMLKPIRLILRRRD